LWSFISFMEMTILPWSTQQRTLVSFRWEIDRLRKERSINNLGWEDLVRLPNKMFLMLLTQSSSKPSCWMTQVLQFLSIVIQTYDSRIKIHKRR
jgi:hypothetical protein